MTRLRNPDESIPAMPPIISEPIALWVITGRHYKMIPKGYINRIDPTAAAAATYGIPAHLVAPLRPGYIW